MSGRLQNRTSIITGAGRGIGRAIALAFGREGARVLVNDIDKEAADVVAAEVGDNAAAEYSPIGSVASAERLVQAAVETFGSVDILVNNAGILRDKMTHNMTEDDFDRVIEVHLKGTWACGREVIRLWRPLAKEEQARGEEVHRKIINVTSPSGLIGAVGQSNYAAAKMGIVGLTKTWAKELGRLAINVNAVSPTALTAMTQPLVQDEEQKQQRLQRFAMGRYGAPDEIAPSFVFLASHDSDYMTGQVLCVDGGLVI